MWKLWPIKNHGWMKSFHPILNDFLKDKTLDEKYYIQIMDENLPSDGNWKIKF
jgi:hypothetical protein